MKMLNALERRRRAGAARRGRAAARGLSDPAAHALPGRAAHRRRCCGRSSATRQQHGDLLDAPWPEVDAAALAQDEIELVLQVNGKLRGTIACRRAPTSRRSRPRRWRSPEVARFADGKPVAQGYRGAGQARQRRGLMQRRAPRPRRLRRPARWPAAASICAATPTAFATLAAGRLRPRSPLDAELKRRSTPAGARSSTAPAQAAGGARRARPMRAKRSVVASTAAGQVRELQLRARLRFRAAHGRRPRLIAPTEIVLDAAT